jgi:histidine ammonia-lyase
MVSAGALATHDASALLEQAILAAALSCEALLAVSEAFHSGLHAASLQPGNLYVAEKLRALWQGSQFIDSKPKVQDAYSIRCTPQVLGPVRDTLEFLRGNFARVLNAASDNPLIVDETKISGGNFHGQAMSMWHDFLAISTATIANIAERRVFRMVTPELSEGLPPMLVKHSGLDSGLMMPQYTAAALVSDNKTLAHPDSVDSIPSSANQEDHVSMGANAARHALEVLDNVRYVIAIELLTAAQAIDLRPQGPAGLGIGTRKAYDLVRQYAPFIEHDKETSPYIDALVELIKSRKLLD